MDKFKTFWLKMLVAERKDFAKKARISYYYLNQYAYGQKKRLGVEAAAKLHNATNGKISKKSLRPDFNWKLFRA